MKKIFVFVFFFLSAVSFAQQVNDYQYVVVPSKFSFLKKPNEYGLNELAKALFEKYGFVTYLETDDIPEDVRNYNCNKLYADVLENNNFTTTKLTIVLKDCTNKILFTSQEGKSREKDWKIGYVSAFRDAAKSLDNLNYKYNGTITTTGREAEKTINAPAITTELTQVHSQQTQQDVATLFAQPIENGFQLVDNTPKVVMKIYKTGSKDSYIAEKDQLKGMLRQDKGRWIFEYYTAGQLKTETLSIKF